MKVTVSKTEAGSTPSQSYSVHFLCTGNAVRSIMAEALLNQMGQGRFRAFSGGTKPKGEVNARALGLLQMMKVDIAGLRSTPWQDHVGAAAPKFDFVFSVCDSAAGEACPLFIGTPVKAHWGLEDPASVTAPAELQAKLAEFARMDGATPMALGTAA